MRLRKTYIIFDKTQNGMYNDFLLKKGLLNQGPKKVATAKKAMASTQHPAVTKVILDVIKDNGNAIDAIISACLLQNVYEPHMSNYAGTLDLIYYENSTGKTYCMNAVGELPENISPLAPNPNTPNTICAIGGFAKGLSSLYERFGTKEWSYYCKPAIEAADKGTIMTSSQYESLVMKNKMNTFFPSGREYFYPHGFLVSVGQRWKKPKLAETLSKLSEVGPEYFITGSWAEHFVEKSNEIGWNITLKHIKDYKTRWLKPINFTYKGKEMIGNPPPDAGGLYMAYVLGILEEFDFKSMGHYTNSADTLYTLSWILGRAYNEVHNILRDNLTYKIPSKVLLSKDYQRLVAEIVRESKPIIDLTEDIKLKTSKASNIASGINYNEEYKGGTCHNVILDSEGNWVTMIHTLMGGGVPGLVVDGVNMSGMSYEDGEPFPQTCIGPGRRNAEQCCPILVLDNGEPYMALGTPGRPMLTTPIVLTNIFEFGMDPHKAIDAPRFWPLREEGLVLTVEIENRISKESIAGLAKMGVLTKPLGNYNWRTGSFQIIWKDNGIIKGTSDPRRLGYAEGI